MKSNQTIKNITLASIKRSAINLHEWKWTQIDSIDLPDDINLTDDELTIILSFFSETDWTLITTNNIIGKISDNYAEVCFNEIDDCIFGDFKNINKEKTIFRVTDIYGKRYDFVMETGKASIASIKAIQTVQSLYKSSA